MNESILEKKERLFVMFEKMGESEVGIRYTSTPGYSSDLDTPFAQEWLRLKQEERDLASSAKRDAREEETLSIAKSALAIAEEANRIASEDLAAAKSSAASAGEQARWAMWATIIATIAAIIAAKDQILALIFNTH